MCLIIFGRRHLPTKKIENIIPYSFLYHSPTRFHSPAMSIPSLPTIDELKNPDLQKTHIATLQTLEGCPDLTKRSSAFIRALYYYKHDLAIDMKDAIDYAQRYQPKFSPWYSDCQPGLGQIKDGTPPERWPILRSILLGINLTTIFTTTTLVDYMKQIAEERDERLQLIKTIREELTVFKDFVEPQPLECQGSQFLLNLHALLKQRYPSATSAPWDKAAWKCFEI